MGWKEQMLIKIAEPLIKQAVNESTGGVKDKIKKAEELLGNIPDKVKGADDNTEVSNESGESAFDITKYAPSMKDTIIHDFALPIAGDAASIAGNTIGTWNSILGGALQAMAMQKANDPYHKAIGNPSQAMFAAGAGRLARGGIAKGVGDTVANRAYTMADTLKGNAARLRDMQFQAEYRPNAEYWDNIKRIPVHNAGGASGKGSNKNPPNPAGNKPADLRGGK